MKKLVLFFGIVILSLNVFGQNKGEMYILTDASASFGQVKANGFTHNGSVISTTEKPRNTYLGFDAGFGYFVANNFRLELCLGISYEKQPVGQTGMGSWLFDRYTSYGVCPNLSYYVRLAERFYYVPEIGVNLFMGNYSYAETYYISNKYPYKGYSLYANLLAFEYRVGPHFGLWAGVGCLRYSHRNYYEDDTKFYSVNALDCYLNNGTVAAHFYF